jgi:hypothetical protein
MALLAGKAVSKAASLGRVDPELEMRAVVTPAG